MTDHMSVKDMAYDTFAPDFVPAIRHSMLRSGVE